jgi:hypothetical protein
METTILTLEQMKEAYPDEWLLIAFTAVDAYLNVPSTTASRGLCPSPRN